MVMKAFSVKAWCYAAQHNTLFCVVVEIKRAGIFSENMRFN